MCALTTDGHEVMTDTWGSDTQCWDRDSTHVSPAVRCSCSWGLMWNVSKMRSN